MESGARHRDSQPTRLLPNRLTPPASAQLSYGLSTEYSKQPQAKSDKVEKVDADRLVFAKYYVQQLLQLDEDALHNAWVKVSQGS